VDVFTCVQLCVATLYNQVAVFIGLPLPATAPPNSTNWPRAASYTSPGASNCAGPHVGSGGELRPQIFVQVLFPGVNSHVFAVGVPLLKPPYRTRVSCIGS
jgi:hypothetical protein